MAFVPLPPRIVILYAHPAPFLSRVHRQMADAARIAPGVTVQELYEIYPDFDIDVPREQALLADADLIVFQHPIQLYSMPALLKEWADAVLEHGWAFGENGTALRNKDFWLVATVGGLRESYQADDPGRGKASDFLAPFRLTADSCGMRWLPPFILECTHQMDDAEVAAHVATFRERLISYPHWSGSRPGGQLSPTAAAPGSEDTDE
ncbi:MAG: dehydrogenase [Herminiimonas sp.]|nr:dehydrogenase [Herminiimonas sp.]